MPGVYAADFNAPPGRAGLMLPFTPTTGRIELGVDTGNLKEVGQDQPLFFIAGQLAGAFTRHAGECSIYIIAEWTGTNWGWILFNHLGGSYWDLPNNLEAVKRFSMSVDKNSCYSAVLGTSRFNAVCVAEALLQNKFPAQKMSVYIAGADVIEWQLRRNPALSRWPSIKFPSLWRPPHVLRQLFKILNKPTKSATRRHSDPIPSAAQCIEFGAAHFLPPRPANASDAGGAFSQA